VEERLYNTKVNIMKTLLLILFLLLILTQLNFVGTVSVHKTGSGNTLGSVSTPLKYVDTGGDTYTKLTYAVSVKDVVNKVSSPASDGGYFASYIVRYFDNGMNSDFYISLDIGHHSGGLKARFYVRDYQTGTPYTYYSGTWYAITTNEWLYITIIITKNDTGGYASADCSLYDDLLGSALFTENFASFTNSQMDYVRFDIYSAGVSFYQYDSYVASYTHLFYRMFDAYSIGLSALSQRPSFVSTGEHPGSRCYEPVHIPVSFSSATWTDGKLDSIDGILDDLSFVAGIVTDYSAATAPTLTSSPGSSGAGAHAIGSASGDVVTGETPQIDLSAIKTNLNNTTFTFPTESVSTRPSKPTYNPSRSAGAINLESPPVDWDWVKKLWDVLEDILNHINSGFEDSIQTISDFSDTNFDFVDAVSEHLDDKLSLMFSKFKEGFEKQFDQLGSKYLHIINALEQMPLLSLTYWLEHYDLVSEDVRMKFLGKLLADHMLFKYEVDVDFE
jgi:hypothetical protein